VNSFFFRGGAGNFGAASSWDTYSPDTNNESGFGVANRPPSSDDYTEIDAGGSLFGNGVAHQLNITSIIFSFAATDHNYKYLYNHW
jgi:hypothetical protein